ncbi:MAG: dehydrogenase, partial [Bacteroidetes bacterium]
KVPVTVVELPGTDSSAVDQTQETITVQANANSPDITKLALRHLDPGVVKTSQPALASLQKLMDETYGTPEYIELVQRYAPAGENARLRKLAIEQYLGGIGRDATRQLLKQDGESLVWEAINGADAEAASHMITALRWVGSKPSLNILKTVATDENRPMALRKDATRAIGGSGSGEDMVIAMLKAGEIKGDLKAAAVQGVSNAWRKSIRTEAASYLDGGTAAATKKLPPMPELLAMNGSVEKGATVFKTNCAICHQINGEGMDFGPKLSEIGSKLPKEAQYLAILHPDAGISFGYEGYEVKFKDGSTASGIVSSKTETDLQLKFPGGVVQNYKMADVVSMKKMDSSMMPSGLQDAMSTQELVDLVDYLASLKKK